MASLYWLIHVLLSFTENIWLGSSDVSEAKDIWQHIPISNQLKHLFSVAVQLQAAY